MKEQELVFKYIVVQFKPSKLTCNESEIGNALKRAFDQDQELKVIVSDLTYVRVGQKWHYICVLVDLYNREIIDHSGRLQKSAALVQRALHPFPTIFTTLNCSTRIEEVRLRINLSIINWKYFTLKVH